MPARSECRACWRFGTRQGSQVPVLPWGSLVPLSDGKVCVSCQLRVAAQKAIAFCDYINRSLVSGSMWLRVPLHLALVKPHLEAECCEELSLGAPRGQI